MFWVLWFVIVIVNCIIFLNFIIAEVSASYQIIKENVTMIMLQEKCILVAESEDMIRVRFGRHKLDKWSHLFPDYIISRE